MAAIKKTTRKKTAANTMAVVANLKSSAEIQAALVVAQSELVEAKQSHAARELTNTSRLKELRVYIARLNTVLTKLINETRDASTALSVKEKA